MNNSVTPEKYIKGFNHFGTRSPPSSYASSQLCSTYGYKNKEVKNLALRDWTCPKCQAVRDRDLSVSRNLLKLAG